MNSFDRRRVLALAGGAAAYAGLARAEAPALAPRSPSPTGADVRFIDVNGARLAYERHGSGRPPLVFVHGYALRGTGAIYAPLISRLIVGFDVYALDLRGHGASASSFEGWSQTALADDVAAFVTQLGLQRPAYAGHSLGGFTGMLAQIRHPGTFSALCLLATAVAAGGTPPAGVKEAFVTRGRDRAFTSDAFASMYVRPTAEHTRAAAEAVSVIDPSVHETFFSNFARHVITDRLAEIQVPVLLLNGTKDTVVSPAEQHRTAAGLPLSKEVIFSSEGHMLPIEAAEATAREILTFLEHDVGGTLRR